MNTVRSIWWGLLLTIGISCAAAGQPRLVKDYSAAMEIPSVIAMESSPAHTYLLSDSEGMVVFRNKPDTLQWLYSSTGMEQRGHTATADIRFAYLFGDSRRLTVLEPTSVLGVYSSTLLPAQPLDARRIERNLYVALGERGLGKISLETQAAVDSTLELIEPSRLNNERVLDLESSADRLFALVSGGRILVFRQSDNSLNIDREIHLDRNINALFLIENTLYGSDNSGNIYEIENSGSFSRLGNIGEPVEKIGTWREWLIIRGSSDRLWTSYQNRAPRLWKDDEEAGNHFAIIKDRLWLCEYNRLSKVTEDRSDSQITGSDNTTGSNGEELSVQTIPNQVIPYTKPLLLTIHLENNFPLKEVKFNYRSDIENARVRGNSFYWKPTSDDIGQHRFRIIATAMSGETDSTSFRVDVRSFNAPPRFAPVRPTTIPVNEEFTLPFSATDPDGTDPKLVRYLGVDLPDGAELDEKTGEFRWTPTPRQAGENKFRVIATDQFGAASSIDVILEVTESVQREGPETGN